MGGNVRVKNIKAEQIPLKEIGREVFIKKIKEILFKINRLNIWNKEIINNGYVFNGSTSFVMNPIYDDETIISIKETIGDIDVTVPKECKESIKRYLRENEIPYIDNKVFDQYNSIFKIDFGKIKCNCQIDFEFVEYKNDLPDDFAKFSHSSSFEDAKLGIKAVFHKLLLGAITYLTVLNNAIINDNIKHKSNWVPKMQVFDVSKGFRQKYIKTNETYMGLPIYIKNTEDSNTNLEEFYRNMFSENLEDISLMWSFKGVCELMKKYYTQNMINIVNRKFTDMLFGENNHRISKDKEEDRKLKENAYNYFTDYFDLPNNSKYF